MTTKICSKCQKDLPTEAFNKKSASKDGLQVRCRKCQYKLTLEWKRANKDRNYELDRKWVGKNREAVRKISREHYARHREKEVYRSAEKRVKRKLARSFCLTPEQEQQIKYFYWLAKDLSTITGESYHVDHIVPLQGKTVCGLHVPWNLQVLPADINLSKGNKHGNLA